MLPLWIFFLFINIPFFLSFLLVCWCFISCSSLFYFYSLLCYSCPIFFLLFYCPLPLLIAGTMFNIWVFMFIFVTLTFLSSLFWCLAVVCPNVTEKPDTWGSLLPRVLYGTITIGIQEEGWRWWWSLYVVCWKCWSFVKLAAFGSKCETLADTFEVGSCCSWCATDRHRE